MSWQVNYALENINKHFKRTGSAEHVSDDAIKISIHDRPDTLAIISASHEITIEIAKQYHEKFPDLDFICGYRTECVWTGEAIKYLSGEKIGWGNAGTLYSALSDNTVNIAAHKDYFFSYRLITQMRVVRSIAREFDRVFNINLADGRKLRVGMLLEYEPTADAVRSFWERFGPVDVMWNINPNGDPTKNALEAGRELGCGVMKWSEFKELILRR
ncbi:hypothetical protein ABEG93_19315 [Pantoea agglomerans]|jgi:hypothetical protein|uniref:hypothetical protein n=2 Tax=Pantoea TaxID=53335 RepID=UPI0015FDED48|nr:hypothetical protein [Pantoea agglomerans]MBA8869907.1 hypothetical protein [Pantoea agglomerans]MBA8874285.1 hypothetical protein [Pantoea agglomerans]